MEKIRATQLAGLEKFAGVVFEGAQGKYTLDEYAYFDDGSMFSTANFLSAAGVIAAGAEQSLFSVPVGANGQGFAAGTNMTLSDTNMERGWDGGKAPANQAYVAVAGGFEIYRTNAVADVETVVGSSVPILNAQDMFQIISTVSWSWNVGGDASPRLSYDPIKFWPLGAGMSAMGAQVQVDSASAADAGTLAPVVQPGISTGLVANSAKYNFAAVSNGGPASVMRKFVFPLFFPPNVAVDCRVRFNRAITLSNGSAGSDNIRIAFHLRGYKLNRIV